MNPRLEAKPSAVSTRRQPAAERPNMRDKRFDEEVTRLLREAAEVREQRESARASEDDLSARREAAGLMRLIESNNRPKPKHPDSRFASRHSPRSGGEQT